MRFLFVSPPDNSVTEIRVCNLGTKLRISSKSLVELLIEKGYSCWVSAQELPQRAKIVIIGGGVGGASVAYHLAQLGERDVLLLDRSDLTSGSTFHSAGLVGQLRADPTLTKMNMHSVDLYRKLEMTETPASWRECGSIKIASTVERMEEIRLVRGRVLNFVLPVRVGVVTIVPEVSDGEIVAALDRLALHPALRRCVAD